MKKLLLTCSVSALLVGAAGYADAQVEGAWLHANTVLNKTVVTNEAITIATTVSIIQPVVTLADDAAESSATGQQTNSGNQDCGNCAEKADVLYYSQDTNTGLTSVNQAGGNDNNQGTLVSAAVDTYTGSHTTPSGTPTTPSGTPTAGQGFAHAQAEATQVNSTNDVEAVDLTFRNALIDHSDNGNVGLTYTNQATGNNNNQLNELSLAFSERPSGTALAESDLGQFNTGNRVGEGGSTLEAQDPVGINKTATVTASLNNNIGVFGVNQSSGNNGNQANIVTIAAVGSNLPGF
jgi:hypothetical protein